MEYRAYVVGEDGHFIRAVQLVCSDDSAARAEAKRLVDGHDIELWQGDRKVATRQQADHGELKPRSGQRLDSVCKKKKTQTSFKRRSPDTKGWPSWLRTIKPASA